MEKQEYLNIFKNEARHFYYVCVHQLVHDFIRDYGAGRKLEILDAGCGTGGLLIKLKDLGTVTGVDKSPEAINFAKKRGLKIKPASVEKLPFKSGYFDAVTSIDVIYHRWVKSDMKALLEMRRVLVSGGVLILRVPANPRMVSEHDRIVYTKRRYEKEELRQKLRNAGFEVKKLSYMHAILLPLGWLSRGQKYSAIGNLPDWLNRLLIWELEVENRIIKRWSLPFGQGLVAVAIKA